MIRYLSSPFSDFLKFFWLCSVHPGRDRSRASCAIPGIFGLLFISRVMGRPFGLYPRSCQRLYRAYRAPTCELLPTHLRRVTSVHPAGLKGFPSLCVFIISHDLRFVKSFFLGRGRFFNLPLPPRSHRDPAGSSSRRSARNLGTAWGTRRTDRGRKGRFRKSLWYLLSFCTLIIAQAERFVKLYFGIFFTFFRTILLQNYSYIQYFYAKTGCLEREQRKRELLTLAFSIIPE